MPSERRRALGDRDSGAVAVETALVSMLLLTLIFGIVETSLLFKDWLTVSAAARAGARMGSSEPRMATFAQDSVDQVSNAISGLNQANALEVWVYEASYATGLPASGSFSTCTVNCVLTNGRRDEEVLRPVGSWASTSQNACAGDAGRNAIGVYVKYAHSGMGFFFNGNIVSESTVMWIEPIPNTSCKP